MRCIAPAVCLAAFLVGWPGTAAAGDSGRAEVRLLTARIEPRVGVRHGSLIVMPLVLRKGVPKGTGPEADSAGLTWSVDAHSERVRLARGAAPPDAAPVLVPTGKLLTGGERERLVPWPLVLAPGGTADLRAPLCDSRPQPAVPAQRGFGALAPLEQRKLALLGSSAEDLSLVQQIQGTLARTRGSERTVSDVLRTKVVQVGVRSRWETLKKIPRAYAGRTVGHVAFFGLRPMALVLHASPTTYASLAEEDLRSIAASHTLWSVAQTEVHKPERAAELRDLIEPCRQVLAACAGARFRKEPIAKKAAGLWTCWKGRTATKVRKREPWRAVVCRFARDGGNVPVFLEAYEHGRALVLPSPLRKPGGRPTSEPEDRFGGAETEEYLERRLRRLRENRDRPRGR